MWTRITDTLASEFSDATDVEQITRILLRLSLAALLVLAVVTKLVDRPNKK